MSIFLLIFNTKIIFFTYAYVSIHISIQRSIYLFYFIYNFYAIVTCFQKKSVTRSPVRMHGYHARAFD